VAGPAPLGSPLLQASGLPLSRPCWARSSS